MWTEMPGCIRQNSLTIGPSIVSENVLDDRILISPRGTARLACIRSSSACMSASSDTQFS
jgi:hypothetical protein